MPNNQTVFIVDDDVELCRSLQWLLESINLTTKVYNNGIDFLNDLGVGQPIGCILLDIRMPGMGGLELQEQLNLRHNTLPIIIMTGHGDVLMAVRAMKAGAFDFLTKPFNDQILLEQINKAISHNQKIYYASQKNILIKQRFDSLTPREKEILERIIGGNLNKEIAFEFNVSIKTVELHRAHIMKKMEASTVAELVKLSLSLPEGSLMIPE